MEKILITGASGMLGATLANELSEHYKISATGNSNFDGQHNNYLKFDLEEKCYDKLINWSDPDIVIHCAAITNGNECDANPRKANLINGNSVQKIIQSTSDDTRIIYISSDAVFASSLSMANEEDSTCPESAYGKSKELGEKFLKESERKYHIIRTTIVGQNINKNKTSFIEWIIDSSLRKKPIGLFNDVFFTPITTWDLCYEIKHIISGDVVPGTYHISGTEKITKYQFGIRLLNKLNYLTNNISKSRIGDFKLRAKRSSDQSLDSTKYQQLTNRNLPDINTTINSLKAKFYDK